MLARFELTPTAPLDDNQQYEPGERVGPRSVVLVVLRDNANIGELRAPNPWQSSCLGETRPVSVTRGPRVTYRGAVDEILPPSAEPRLDGGSQASSASTAPSWPPALKS